MMMTLLVVIGLNRAATGRACLAGSSRIRQSEAVCTLRQRRNDDDKLVLGVDVHVAVICSELLPFGRASVPCSDFTVCR